MNLTHMSLWVGCNSGSLSSTNLCASRCIFKPSYVWVSMEGRSKKKLCSKNGNICQKEGDLHFQRTSLSLSIYSLSSFKILSRVRKRMEKH